MLKDIDPSPGGENSLARLSDGKLLRQIIDSQDRQAYVELHARHAEGVYSSIARVAFGNGIDPQDVFQEVFHMLWESPETFLKAAEVDRLLASLRITGIRKVLTQVKNEKRHPKQGLDEGEDFDELLARNGINSPAPFGIDKSTFRQVLDGLRDQDRLLILDYMQGYETRKDLAKLYNISKDSAAKRRDRAFKKLKILLLAKDITFVAIATEIQILNTPQYVWQDPLPGASMGGPSRFKLLGIALMGIFAVVGISYFVSQQKGLSKTDSVTNSEPNLLSEMLPAISTNPLASVLTVSTNATVREPFKGETSGGSQRQYAKANVPYTLLRNSKPRLEASSAVDPILDSPGVREKIAAWESAHIKELRLEYQTNADESPENLGTIANTFSPGEEVENTVIPFGWVDFEFRTNAYDVVSVGRNILSEVHEVLHINEENGNGRNEMYSGNGDMELANKYLREWGSINAYTINKVDIGDGWATVRFTDISQRWKLQQVGFVVLKVIAVSEGVNIWGAEKVVLQPSKPL